MIHFLYGEKIKEYFTNSNQESWNIELVDTGLDTMTGGRLKKIQNDINNILNSSIPWKKFKIILMILSV